MGKPGRQALHYTDGTESDLFNWIVSERSKGFILSLSDIQQRMLELTSNNYRFKASTGWLYGFMRRFQLSMRMPTTSHALTNDIGSNSINSFHNYISHLYQSHCIENVINVDQTPVWWNAMTANQRTINIRGQRNV